LIVKKLYVSEQGLIVGGKDLKLSEFGLNNWWKKNIIFAGQSSVLCKVFKMLLCSFIKNLN